MAEYAEKGLTLRWDVPDLFAAGSRAPCVVVAARPAHPSNAVTVAYTVNGGATRVARGHRMQREPRSDGEEWFAVDLPPQEDGALLTFVPILSCSGREADPRRGGYSFALAAAPPVPAALRIADPPQPARQAFAYAMELLTRVTAPLVRPPVVIGETAEGLRIAFQLAKGGTLRGPRLNGTILHSGGDWMLIRRDG